MPSEEPDDYHDLLDRRADFLEALVDGALPASGLEDRLGCSRSTVTRALRELSDAGLVQQTADGYRTTLTGRLALEQQRNYLSNLDAVRAARPLLESLPSTAPVPASLFEDAAVTVQEGASSTPSADLPIPIDRADHIQVAFPKPDGARLLEACLDRTTDQTRIDCRFPSEPPAVFDDYAWARLDGQDEGGFTVSIGTTPPYGLLVAESAGETTVHVVIDADEIVGTITTDAPTAVDWARSWFETDTETPAPSEVAQQPQSEKPSRSKSDWQEDHEFALRQAGFRDPEAYTGSSLPPPTALRVGLSHAEVAEGYAMDRECEGADGRKNLTEMITSLLHEGDDVVVLGPAGSGKSSVCKQVARHWLDVGHGPVRYRESRATSTFDAPAVLEAWCRESSGHALIVVEDAVRAEANAVFEVITALDGDPGVTFLLDTRQTEWYDPTDLPADARLDTIRCDLVETVSMPPLDTRERERFVSHAESLPGIGPLPREQLLERDDGDADVEAPAELVLFLHELTSFVDDPEARTGTTPTTLVEDIQRAHRSLADAEAELVERVGLLVNLLNAAELEPLPELAYALAADAQEEAMVDEGLELLDGAVFYGDDRRTVHAVWSLLFLREHIDAVGDRAATRDAAACVQALFDLVTTAAARERLSRLVDTSLPDELTEAPGAWATNLIERLFGLGMDVPALAPLFGTVSDSWVEIPAVCPPELPALCLGWRSEMLVDAGDLEAAEEVLTAMAEMIDSLREKEIDGVDKLEGYRLERRSRIADRRGEYDRAETIARRAIAAYHAAGDRRGEARSLNGLGVVKWLTGDLKNAQRYLVAARVRYEKLNASRGEADNLNNLGCVARTEGDYAAADDYFQRSLEIRQRNGDRLRTVDSLLNLGVIARDRGDLDRALSLGRRSVVLAQEVGGPDYEAYCRKALGNTLLLTGDVEGARTNLQESLALFERIENPDGVADAHRSLAAVERERGDLNAASEHAHAAREGFERIGDERNMALALMELGATLRAAGDLEAAEDQLFESLAKLRRVGRNAGRGEAQLELGVVSWMRGNESEARGRFHTGLRRFQESGVIDAAVVALERRLRACDASLEERQRLIEALREDVGSSSDLGERLERLAAR